MEQNELEQSAVNELIKSAGYHYERKKNDNNGRPKVEYFLRLIRMTDEELRKECKNKIWLSAYASNNPRSDYHWHCDTCYDECNRRGKPEIYNQAHKSVSESI